MKRIKIISFSALHLSLIALSASAAVPLRWTVETSRLAPAVFDVVRGETIALEAAFNSSGKPFAMDLEPVSIFWQTNGMGSAWWTAPAVATSNLVRATFTPEMDPGAATVNGFLGSSGSIYRAAFTFRFRHGPGATPNALPLPVPIIDFAKVRVLNPPWSGGGGGGVDTNAVRDIVRDTLATNGIRSVDGAARPLPKYLHLYEADDSYPAEAEEYYRSRGNGKTDGGCSSVRDGGFLYRNFDYPFDERSEFVVKMSAGYGRFASVGVAQVGTNLTEIFVTSGKPSRCYKWLPGATVDGVNENGVACNINVVDGDPQTSGWHTTGDLHPLAAIRHILDHATNAQHAATYIAANIRFPAGWTQNFHYMIADETATYIVENGTAYQVTNGVPAMTNFRLYGDPKDTTGEGQERYIALTNGANITSQWWTLTYTANGYRASDLPGITGETLTQLFNYWENNPRESHRGESFGDKVWWQTVHTSIYDITNRVLRVSVQETDDWYTFQVPASGSGKSVDAYTKAETDAKLEGKIGTNGTWRVSDDWEIDGVISPPGHGHTTWWFSGGSDTSDFSGYAELSGRAYEAFTAESANTSISATIADDAVSARALNSYDGDTIDIEIVDEKSTFIVKDEFHPEGFRLKPASDDISADNPHFTNAVIQTMKGVTPQPSPELRLWDPVLNRWVILKCVNMNITLEVE